MGPSEGVGGDPLSHVAHQYGIMGASLYWIPTASASEIFPGSIRRHYAPFEYHKSLFVVIKNLLLITSTCS